MADDEAPDTLELEADFDELALRAEWGGGASAGDPDRLGLPTTRDVTGPGLAALQAVGDRAPRRAAAVAAADPGARDNWRPTGPRNVTGRIRAIAVDPGDSNVLYAGAASGGIWKTVDGGERWFPLWHDEPSLAFGAIAVAPSRAARVYAATGEIDPAGLNVAGHGIWVSDDAGANWHNKPPDTVPGANPRHDRGFEALAVDPTNPDHCWAVGGDGVFRSVNGGTDWQFLDGTYFSDVAFSDGRVWLARAKSLGGEGALIRLDRAQSTAGTSEADARAALSDPLNISTVVPAMADHLAWPARAKLVLSQSPGSLNVGYVRFVDEDERHLGLFRTRTAQAAHGSDVSWFRMPDHPDWLEEVQGLYNLCLAIDPTNPDHIGTGMLDFHVCATANQALSAVTYRRAISWQLYYDRREFHADNHAALVVAGQLWVANDGGLALSANWATGEEVPREVPIDPRAIAFRRRDNGLVACQPYDLNQSPAVPTVYAIGLQDNGVQLTAGGPLWRMVNGGDGGFVLFDPDDPFRFVLTWQGGIESNQFPGHIDVMVPGEQPDVPVARRRTLDDGFRALDDPAFVADTARHPLRRDRLLHTRRRRLYGTRGSRGERWDVEPMGPSFEFLAASTTDTVQVEVVSTPGAIHLGLVPGIKVRRFPYDPMTDPKRPVAVTPVSSRLPAPWNLEDGDEVHLRFNGTDAVARFREADVVDIHHVTLQEVLRILQPALPAGSEVLPRLWPTARAVELVTRGQGPAQKIVLSGTAVAPLPADGLSRLGLNEGTYNGDDGRPASVSLGFEGWRPSEQRANRDLSGAPALELTVAINDGAPHTIRFEAPDFADPTAITAGELAAALDGKLPRDQVEVVATDMYKAVYLRADPGVTIVVSGSAADRMEIANTDAETRVLRVPTRRSIQRARNVRNYNSFDLHSTGAPLTLTISDGPHTTGPLSFVKTPGVIADEHCVTVEEMHGVIRRGLDAVAGIRIQAELVIVPQEAQASEVLIAPSRPREAWAGGAEGSVFRTIDDGATWLPVGPAEARLADARVEAIAVHPTDPRTAYVGLWRSRPGPAGRGLLFRTKDGGGTWEQVGSRQVGPDLVGIVAERRPLAIMALEVDPNDVRVVFAGSEGGVFRSLDGGDTWEPFNHGLPNCPVIDLAMVGETRVLRAATWGRGTWERRIGTEPPGDARLVIRSSELDDGWARPPRGGPDLFATAPTGDPPSSPDIKVVRRRPAQIGPDDRSVDGVEFDLEVPDDVVVDVPAGPLPDHQSQIMVQVHNRGSFPAASTAAPPPDTAVRVVVLWTPLTGPPPSLPLDFWTRFKTASLNPVEGDWHVAGDRRLPEDLRSDAPAVAGFTVTWPRDIGAPRIGILALVTAGEDGLDGGPTDVVDLVTLERRVAFRSVPVTRSADDRTLVLRATGPRSFRIRPPAAGTNMAPRLQFAAADFAAVAPAVRRFQAGTVGTPTYDLSGAQPGLLVIEDPVIVDIEFHNDLGEFADIHAASPAEIAAFIDARLQNAGAAASAFAVAVGIRLRGLGGAQVRVVSGTAAARLGGDFTGGGVVSQLTAIRKGGFDLTGTPTLKIEVRAQANRQFDVTFRPDDLDPPAAAGARTIALIVSRAIAAARLEGVVRCDEVRGILIYRRGEKQVTAAGAAMAPLDLAGGPARFLRGAFPAPVDLSARPHLTVTVENRVTVRFDREASAIPDLAHAEPPDVRRVLNTAFEVADLSVRAEAARFDLRVRGSTTETTGQPDTLGGQFLADAATSGTTPAGDPAALFDIRAALAADQLTEVAPNHVYVRVRNAGNVDVTPARVRLFRIDAAATPPTLTEVTSGTVPLPAEQEGIVDLQLTPVAAAGAFEHVLVAADQDVDGRRFTPPAPPDLEALVAFCERRTDVAMRTFEVVPP